MRELGRGLMILGGATFVFGLLLARTGRLPLIGRIPGDLVFHRGNFTFYLPLATSVLLSLVLTLLLLLLRR
jgi:hypothetical protein